MLCSGGIYMYKGNRQHDQDSHENSSNVCLQRDKHTERH